MNLLDSFRFNDDTFLYNRIQTEAGLDALSPILNRQLHLCRDV